VLFRSDHFKNINDAYGHKAGDALLIMLAQLLKACLRDGDTLARWGGDEFVVLLPDLTATDAVRQVAQKMVEAMRQTLVMDGLSINATFSMGIAVYPDDESAGDIESLLAQADRAMFYAKSQGRNNFQLFSDMSSKGLGKKEMYIQTRLAQAIRGQHIGVWFQPQVAAQPHPDGRPRLVGIEALARWHDADLGWISPGSFIPMAENLGLINELGIMVWRRSFEHFSLWRRSHPDLKLSINISKRQLFSTDFMQLLMNDVESYGLDPRSLVLEVTESVALMDVEFAEARLRQLAQAGFTLSIDDFGTGYASLSQLHELPIGELKIDISFVRRVRSVEGLRMAQGIVSLAQALRLHTVAEGVEDEATAQVLRDLGVDVLQGYHFARPCPATELMALPLFKEGVALNPWGDCDIPL
jgi:diguanylate cyclase (GGDEF)-like protein